MSLRYQHAFHTSPVEDLAADIIAADINAADIKAADTIAVDTISADTISADTIAELAFLQGYSYRGMLRLMYAIWLPDGII